LKLTIVAALRVVLRNGPDARQEDMFDYGGLLVGYDPVAVDAVGLDTLTRLRYRVGLREPLRVRYLRSAGDLGVGRCQPAELERVAVASGG
jgi:hypothetical protein